MPDPLAVNFASLRLRCFGSPSLTVETGNDEPKLLLPAGKPLLILAYLVAHPERGASRETLTTLGWGNRDDAHAKASLRQTLYRLRQLLGRDSLTEEGTSIRLTTSVASDWETATRGVALGDDALLLSAVGGVYLEGIEADDDAAGGGWLAAERMRWERQRREAGVREGRRALVAGRTEQAIALAEGALTTCTDHLATWALYLDALSATEVVTRIEDGLARLEAVGEQGLLGSTDSQGWQLLARRVRRSLDRGAPATDTAPSPPGTLPFTGRSLLLAHVQLLFHLPPDQSRRIIAIVASAGFGKTRLLRELRLRQSGGPGTMVSVEARGNETTIPFALLNRVVEALAALPEALGTDPEAAAVLVAANPRLAKRFASMDGTPRAMPSPAAIADALGELVGAVSEHRPLQLLVDDTQWGDPASLEQLEATFAGSGPGRAVCLFATRDLNVARPPHWHVLHLSSLTSEDIATLLASELPSLRGARHAEAAEALLLVTGGVPIYVLRALQRLSTLAAGGAAGDDFLAAIPGLVLHRDPAFPAGEVDRRVLGYLAIAGGTVGQEELGGLEGVGSFTAVRDRLEQLERAGWVVRRAAGYQLSHDLVQQQAIEGLSPAEQRTLALHHVRWLSLHGEAFHDLQRAVRVSLAQGEEAQAVQAVRHWRRRVRGGPRGRTLAALVLPADAPRRIRWRVTAAATPALLRLVSVAVVMVALIGWGVAVWLRQPASLRLENIPRVPGIDAAGMGRVRRNSDPPLFTVRDRMGRISTALDGRPLEIAGWSDAVDSARLEAPTLIKDGQCVASELLVYAALQDSLRISFRVGNLPELPVVVFRGFEHQSLRLEGGVINGRVLDPRQPEIVVRAGDSLVGFVRMRYSTPSQAALWMLAATSTMRPAIEDTTTVITLHAGAYNAITEPFVQRRASLTPGVYWLIWAFAAEKDAVSILSLTNWRCGAPHWNDGNDLATAPDSVFGRIWGGGALEVARDLCDEGVPPRRELSMYPAATVRVVVKSR